MGPKPVEKTGMNPARCPRDQENNLKHQHDDTICLSACLVLKRRENGKMISSDIENTGTHKSRHEQMPVEMQRE